MAFLYSTVCLLQAGESPQKRELKNDMTEIYNILPVNANNVNEIFTKGELYGRLRFNSFIFNWDEEITGVRKDYYTIGVGGSLIYKSAYLNGFGFTLGGYTTQNPLHMDDEYVKYYTVGKGVLSRYKVATQGEYGLTSLAQAYMEYRTNNTSIRLGRQIFESHMTKSNDIKMIPNTFEGITLQSEFVSKYNFKAAFLTKQKLRDHTDFHHVFAYDDGPGEYDKWRENDDTAMHKGITLSKLEAAGIDDKILLIELNNVTQEEVEWLFNYTAVPELFSSSTLDLGYKWMNNSYQVATALRYTHQFDHCAGEMGGANLKTNTVGYKNPNSLEADLYGARLDIAKDSWKFRMGITHIGDKGDIISPWRAFPTGGFGYSLLQYNWYANTTSYLLESKYSFKHYHLQTILRYAVQDFDDKKPGVQADSNVLQLDLIKKFKSVPNLYGKVRMVNVTGDNNTIALGGIKKLDPSYNEIRFELNYLF